MNHLAAIGEIRIVALDDLSIEPGHQWLGFSVEGGGAQLAALLDPDFENRPEAAHLRAEHPGWLWLPHNHAVDDRLLELFDAVTAIRIGAPQLMQLMISLDVGGQL